jgi:cell division protein FtsX
VLLVAAGVRLLVAPRRRGGGGLLLVGATAALVLSGFLWNWATLLGTYVPGSWADVGGLVSVVAVSFKKKRMSR